MARQELTAVQQELLAKNRQLRTADDKEVSVITREIQRLRVSAGILREIVNDLSDPTTYRELTLLNKLVTGIDPEEDARAKEQEAHDLDAEARLRAVGIDPANANLMVRALNSLKSLMDPESDDGRQPTPPDTVQ